MAVLTTGDLGAQGGVVMGDAGVRSSARVAIVTGGASGIGLAISERLAADGMAVALFDRDGKAADQAAEKIAAAGDRALGVTVDVTDRGQIDAGVAQVRGEPARRRFSSTTPVSTPSTPS